MTQVVSILGSTGSIGRQTLDVIDHLPIRVAALTANRDVARMEEQCRKYRPKLAVMADEQAAMDLKTRLADTEIQVEAGMEAICRAVPAHIRVRLGSLEPRTITPEFCRRAAALPNLCPHFHLSMQSGCDSVLARMNRKYDSERYYESVRLLNEAYETPGITTDLIVGFPGETEEEFQQTLAFIRRCAFSAMHIFPYSRRPGTPADGMPGQILNSVKEERAHRAQQAALEMEAAYLDRWVGRTVPVLFEEERDGLWRGHTTRYSEVAAPSGENLHNQLRQVYITGRAGNILQGELCEGQEK